MKKQLSWLDRYWHVNSERYEKFINESFLECMKTIDSIEEKYKFSCNKDKIEKIKSSIDLLMNEL